MFDLKAIRDDPHAFDAGLGRRGFEPHADKVLAIDVARREAISETQALQTERNAKSKAIGAAKGKGEDVSELIAAVGELKSKMQAGEERVRVLDEEIETLLSGIPNIPAADVPDGPDETANVEMRRIGEPRALDFTPRQHFELGEALGLMDFEAAARMSGARFVVLSGALARLERAIANFMLDLQTGENGYREIRPPYLVRDSAAFGTGQLPKFAEDLFKTEYLDPEELGKRLQFRIWPRFLRMFEQGDNGPQFRFQPNAPSRDIGLKTSQNITQFNQKDFEDLIVESFEEELKEQGAKSRLWLIPTAEVPLTNLVREQILDEASLPMRVTAHTPCFRAEAGAAGKDTRGMIRLHQFDKVELVSIVAPGEFDAELERMTGCAEEVLKRLDLPYRVVMLSTGDMGFSARKTYDLEVWLPGQDAYREISSCSSCGDFQARRMNARYRPAEGKGTAFVHTLNGSGLAVGRTLVAVLENYQNADGTITVPEALRPYMGGIDVIGPQ